MNNANKLQLIIIIESEKGIDMIYIMHLSDLHIINSASWSNMKACMLNKLEEQMKLVEPEHKLLVITGDFHNYWDNDYEKAKTFILELVKRTGLDIKQDVFLVPGNHDLYYPKTNADYLLYDTTKKLVKVQTNELNKGTISILLKSFARFNAFCKDLQVEHESDCAANVHVRIWRNKLNLLHLNTALIADGKQKNDQLLDIETLAGDLIRQELNNNLPTIAIGHNNFYDLNNDIIVRSTASFRQEDVRAYLCGDNHKFNNDRYKKRIPLGSAFGAESIPNIVCSKSATDDEDTYSDFGFLIHCWDEDTGNVNLQQYEWIKDRDQNSFKIDISETNAYVLSVHNKRKTEKHHKDRKSNENTLIEEALQYYRNYIQHQCGEIDLNGLPERSDDLRRTFALDRIFVPVSFSKKDATSDPFLSGDLLDLPGFSDFLSGHHNSTTLSLETLLPDNGNFKYLILAGPGAGKT